MAVVWSDRSAGEIGRLHIDKHPDDPTALVISDGLPDWVRIPPQSPRFAGEVRRVTSIAVEACPATSFATADDLANKRSTPCGRRVYHLRLDGPGRLRVACCPAHGMNVYQVRLPVALEAL